MKKGVSRYAPRRIPQYSTLSDRRHALRRRAPLRRVRHRPALGRRAVEALVPPHPRAVEVVGEVEGEHVRPAEAAEQDRRLKGEGPRTQMKNNE